MGPLVHESGPPAAALLGVTHCAKPEHVGIEGSLSHVCRSCNDTLVCRSCSVDDHLMRGHTVDFTAVVAKQLQASIAESLPRVRAGAAHYGTLAASTRSQLLMLASSRAAAESDVEAKFLELMADMRAQRERRLAAIQSAFDAKASQLHTLLVRMRGAIGDLGTAGRVGEFALAGASPSAVVHAHKTLAHVLHLADDRCAPQVDTTLHVEAESGCGYFPLGRLVTQGVDAGRSTLEWASRLSQLEPDGSSLGRIGGAAVAVITLVRADGSPGEVPAGTLEVRLGEAEATVTARGRGVYDVWGIPSQPDVTTVKASYLGHPISGSPLHWPGTMIPPSPCTFDPEAGTLAVRTLSADNTTLTTVGTSGYINRGRSVALRTGPGLALDICLEVATGPSPHVCFIGIDKVKEIPGDVTSYGSNRDRVFFYNSYHGGVNTAWMLSSGHPTLRAANASHVFHFHVTGDTLTFSHGVGRAGCAVTRKPGSWTLPPECYLLIAASQPGYVFRLFTP